MIHPIVWEDLERIAADIKDEAGSLEGATLLISGGGGFIGSYMVGAVQMLNREYFSKPCHIISLDNYATARRASFIDDLLDQHVEVREADVKEPLKVERPVEYIVHAAGLASPYYYRKYPLETIDTAVLGVRNLLEFARESAAKGFLFFSSSEIYGDPEPRFVPTPEFYKGNVSCTGPRSCYDESKRLAETICMVYRRKYDLPVKIVRPFNTYGPGMNKDDYRVVPTFLVNGLRGESLPVYSDGNQTRTFCYISDAVTGFFRVLLSGRDGEAYNVGSGSEEVTMKEFADTVCDLFGGSVRPKLMRYPDAYPADEPRRRCPDLSKIRKELGYDPRIDLSTGLSRTLVWFRDTLSSEKGTLTHESKEMSDTQERQ